MKKLVIVGCGRLAEIVADAVVKGLLPDYDLVGVYSRTASKAAHIVHKMQQHGKPCIACATLEELLALKPDYLVYRCFGRRDILSGSGRNSQGKWYTNLYRLRSYRWIRCFKNCLSDGKYDGPLLQ